MPYSFASLRTMMNGSPDASDAAAASATAPSAGPASRVASGRVLRHCRRDPLADRAEQVGPRLEAVLVEVVAGALPGAEDEVALEVRVLDERARERIVLAHLRAAASACRASGSSRSASGEPSTNETIDPSPK